MAKKEERKLKAFMLDCIEAGVDEVGRGALCGPVVTAAVVLPKDFDNSLIKDSKKLNRKQLEEAYKIITKEALTWATFKHEAETIDEHNILNTTIMAMHGAIEGLNVIPGHIIVDGNQFHDYYSGKNFEKIPHTTVVKGDATYYSIAAASILAKVTRDKLMEDLAKEYPVYGWDSNVGYGTQKHRDAIKEHGITKFHRKSFLGNIMAEMNTKPLF